MPTYTVDQICAAFVKQRDKIKDIKDRHKAELEPENHKLDVINQALLKHLLDTNAQSVKTPAGTFYRLTHAQVRVSDPGVFRQHVIDTGSWNLADVRANKPATQAHVSQNGAAPPGVEYSEFMEAGVRRPSDSGE